MMPPMPPLPMVLPLVLVAQAAPAPPAAKKPAGPVIGRFTIANPGGSLIADLGSASKQVFTFRGARLALRSEGLDLDAASVRIVRTGRAVSAGEAEGPVAYQYPSKDFSDDLRLGGLRAA